MRRVLFLLVFLGLGFSLSAMADSKKALNATLEILVTEVNYTAEKLREWKNAFKRTADPSNPLNDLNTSIWKQDQYDNAVRALNEFMRKNGHKLTTASAKAAGAAGVSAFLAKNGGGSLIKLVKVVSGAVGLVLFSNDAGHASDSLCHVTAMDMWINCEEYNKIASKDPLKRGR